MNANAEKWVAALRSGEYEQAQEVLKSPEGNYCCLGVACELYRNEVDGKWVAGNFHVSLDEIAEDAELPPTVREWLGLRKANGLFGDKDSLIARNDGGESFAEIAALILTEPEGLFA